MALSIRRQSVEEKARRYAALRQITVTDAIEEALDSKLADQEIRRRERAENFIEIVRDVQARVAKLPILDPRPIDEILYDEDGLPR